MQLSSGALVVSDVMNPNSKSGSTRSSPTSSDQVSSSRKIAVEEHFDFAGIEKSMYASFGEREFQDKIADLGGGRLAGIDRGSIEICIVSLVGPGLQAIPHSNQAGEVAWRVHDHLAECIAKYRKRLKGFSALALQGPNPASSKLKSSWDTSRHHCAHPLWPDANGRGG